MGRTPKPSYVGAVILSLAAIVSVFAQTPTTASTQEIFGTYYLNDGEFYSELILRNERFDVPITVEPALWLAGGREITLAPVTIPPRSVRTISLSEALADQSDRARFGSVVVRYQFRSSGAVTGITRVENERGGVTLGSIVQGRQEFAGSDLQAVFWTPDPQMEGFVSLLNTSSATRHATVYFYSSVGAAQVLREITLSARENFLFNLKDVLAKNQLGGIRVTSDGQPGDVMAEGALFNRSGFAKRVLFNDLALHYVDSVLRTHWLLLGAIPPEVGFKPGVVFRSVAVLRNVSSELVGVSPTIDYMENGSQRHLTLTTIQLPAGATQKLDFSELQQHGVIPSSFNIGSLSLMPDKASSIIAELTNYDQAGGYVVGPSFVQRPAKATTALWRADEDWQTRIAISNAAPIEDEITIDFFYEGGSYRMPAIHLPAGALAAVNVRDLLQSGAPSTEANGLPPSSGYFVASGSHGLKSGIVMEALIYSTTRSDYIGLPPEPSPYITSAGATFINKGDGTVAVFFNADWNDGSATQEVANNSVSSSNPALAAVISDPTWSWGISIDFSQPRGSSANVDLNMIGPSCAAYSSSNFFSRIPIFRAGESFTWYQFESGFLFSQMQPCPEPGSTITCTAARILDEPVKAIFLEHFIPWVRILGFRLCSPFGKIIARQNQPPSRPFCFDLP
jgi:hypothetical protein